MFHGGPYGAAVGMAFEYANDAAKVLAMLGAPWRVGETNVACLIGFFTSETFEAFKREHGPKGRKCERKRCRSCKGDIPIDSLAHSIDYGPTFDVYFEVEE